MDFCVIHTIPLRMDHGQQRYNNHYINEIEQRLQALEYCKWILHDAIPPKGSVDITFDWRRNSEKEESDEKDKNGKKIKKYIKTTHSLNISYTLQRP
jgi:hypothetical protein